MLAGICGIAVGVFGLIPVPLYWTGKQKIYDQPMLGGTWKSHTDFGRDWALATRRAQLPGAITFLVTGIVLVFFRNSSSVLPLIAVVACWAIDLTSTFFNRPRFLVPPAYRSEPGVVALYLARRRRSKSQS